MNKKNDIIVSGSKPYYRISNADGKTWLMPARNMRTAMALYQPGSRNGRLLKRWFPVVHSIPGIARFLHAQILKIDLAPEIREAIAKAFGVEDFEWSLFGGTPCVHQKITIQIFSKENILGYVKATDSEQIATLFEHEEQILRRLDSLSVPRVLWRGSVGMAHLFIQSTQKTLKSREIHTWLPQHEEFLRKLKDLTLREFRFEETDYYKTLLSIEPWLEKLPESKRQIIRSVRDNVLRNNEGRTVKFSVYHADFTPWNMVLQPDDTLFVFDWEYAKMSYPPMLDKWHYQLQTAIFEEHIPDEEIVKLLMNHPEKDSLKLYLLDVICRFTVREKAEFTGDMANSFNLWVKLLQC